MGEKLAIQGTFTGYLFSDFTFTGPNSGNLTSTANGPFNGANSVDGVTVDIDDSAALFELVVDDDDPELEDGFQENTGDQTVGAGTTIPGANVGDRIEVEYTLTVEGPPGTFTDIYAVAIGPGSPNNNPTLIFLSDAPLDPTVTYTISSSNDGGPVLYSDLVCFTAGTLILTPYGEVPIEDLHIGDLVITSDNGARPIKWIGTRAGLVNSSTRPVVITAGALHNERELVVSPQHRILISGWRAELLFETPEVLVPAKALINGDTIYQSSQSNVTYIHFMCDRHELVFANGVCTETLQPGAQALTMLDQAARDEIYELFPELQSGSASAYSPVRPLSSVREGLHLLT